MFTVVGTVGMCITGHIMELWETAFAGCGKALAFPCAVNAFSISRMVGYAHFHGVKYLFFNLFITPVICLHQIKE